MIGLYDDIHEFNATFPIEFNDCEFDITNASKKITLFESGEATDKSVTHFTVNGGKIVSDDKDELDFYNIVGTSSTVSFGKGENGAYTLLQLPIGETAPETALPTSEGNLKYSPTATAGLFMLRGASSGIWDIATPANITAGGKATFKGMYYGTAPTSLCLIAAAYEGDKLTKVDFMEAKDVVKDTLVDLTATVNAVSGETVKYFLWDGISSMTPYVFE